MIKFHDVKVGDYVMATFDGDTHQGEVTQLQKDQKLALIDAGAQEFWHSMEDLHGIPLDDNQLMKLKFTKEENADGSVKYKKGAFRMLLPVKDDFSKMEIWYRDERRHIMEPLSVHQLQNHFHDMTKVHLNDETFQ
ncbi:MAG: hypothetical protein ABJA78_14580 [Ferruginibacter sp.]